MQRLEEIKELDKAEGLKNCGTEELYVQTLENFYKLIDIKSAKLKECLEKGLIREYTIEVHALKNTARMAGAMELSELFYQMECLGKEEKIEEIKHRTPEVLEKYGRYKELLAGFGERKPKHRTEIDLQLLKEEIKKLHDAVDEFDLDTADGVMQGLWNYAVPKDLQGEIKRLEILLADVDMEPVLDLTEALEQKLEKIPLVLLIDDDEINRLVVKGLLKEDYRMVMAESGKAAFSVLEKELPDLILLDVYMPQMDGHEVLKRLKETERYAEIPVIFLTGDEDEQTEVLGFSEGAIDFIRKPLQKAVAVQRINRILELSYLQKNLKDEVEKQTAVAEKRRKKVERMSLQMVQALANTIDAKDSYTNGHSTRVAKYSVMLAERMGYEGERLEQLQFAALLHDIGKIGIPREIINKPSRLTDEEYEIIKTHPSIGGGILEQITEIPDIAVGARWHHERYDGKGYPDRLQGDEIPELARIVGVADAYDAMTSKRSYRDVLPQAVVMAEVEKGSGSQFDPAIAELMLELMRKDEGYLLHE